MNGISTQREIYIDGDNSKVDSDTKGEVAQFFFLKLTEKVLLLKNGNKKTMHSDVKNL